jgi:hypothetical protein
LVFGLFQMVLQPLREIAVGGLLNQFGQRLNDLILGVVNVLQSMQQEVVHCLDVFAEEAHSDIPWKGDDFAKTFDGTVGSLKRQ